MLVKFALKTAIATAFLGAIFQDSDFIEHLAYPAMGLINTIQPSFGPTVKKGWGRLAGSAIGGIIGAWLVLTQGSSPITSGLAFFLATLVCELFQFQAASNQAGLIAALVAAQIMGSGNPAQYVVSRIFDNWIGVAIGIGVTLTFWPDNPRKALSDNLVRMLSNCGQLVQSMVAGNWRRQEAEGRGQKVQLVQSMVVGDRPVSHLESQLLDELDSSIQKSKSVLSQEMYGVVGGQLAQENWSNLLAAGDRLHRHLSAMLKLIDLEPDRLGFQFAEPLTLLADRISHTCTVLEEMVQSLEATHSNPFRWRIFSSQQKPLADPDIQSIKASLQAITDQLSQMRSTGTIYHYSHLEVPQFYRFLHHLNGVVQALEQLTIALIKREKTAVQPEPAFRLSWHPVPSNRILHFLKTGFAIWLTLVLLNDWLKLPFNYYAVIAIVVAMQPTLGKVVVAGTQRVIVTGIGAIYALLLINTIGSTPLTLAIGIALIILTSSYLGFTQGYATGCILIILSILTHNNDPNNYIWHRFLETLVGTIIALVLSQLFWPDTSSHQLDQGISQTFKSMGQLYRKLVDVFLQGTGSEEEHAQLSQEIRQSLKSHEALQKETQQEPIYNLMAPRAQRRWNLLLSYEKELLRNLEDLQDAVQPDTGRQLPQELQDAIQASAKATVLSFNQLAKAIGQQSKPGKLTSALSTFDPIDQTLLNLRKTGITLTYSLDQVFSLSAVTSAMKETAENLQQVTNDLS
ncbi:FUSC family protein [Kovacikia minuta CCNUW1]|uniref:FUSC family protein n=1 Tax=Kovacikia minuta TaxID=2931930 RepID=UPI001CCF6715|nr:FUSC family protein [Kovacikia minuta]UBF27803.1 FUSC family protein [Kovacikia minuta CCNUW1]